MRVLPEILVPELASLSKRYQSEVLIPGIEEALGLKLSNREAIRGALRDPLNSLKTFFWCFAFARAGGEQAPYKNICLELLNRRGNYNDGAEFLAEFKKTCRERNCGTNDKLTSSVVINGYDWHLGPASTGSGWLFEAGSRIRDTGTLRQTYLALLSIRGIGEKIAAFLCRDLVWIFDCEGELPSSEKVLIQPIDRWVRNISLELWPEFKNVSSKIDSLVASAICAATAKLNQSDVQFNQGSWYFGSRCVGIAINSS